MLGVLMCCLNWLSFAALAVTLAGYGYRIRIEERALSRDLGAAYRRVHATHEATDPFPGLRLMRNRGG